MILNIYIQYNLYIGRVEKCTVNQFLLLFVISSFVGNLIL